MNYIHEHCQCPEEYCAKGVSPASDCVARLEGVVEAVRCEKCDGETLHHNGECIRCQRVARDAVEEVKEVPVSTPPPTHASPAITLSISLGNKPIEVTDTAKVKRILKILMEG